MLPINEMFYTIQGEAHWTGTPAVFLRLQGCRVGCGFCDTKHTWEVRPERSISPVLMLAKERDDDTHAQMSEEDIARTASDRWPEARHLVVTGGEPADYDLRALCAAFESRGYRVQIETSGTSPVRVSDSTWVTVSPKINMPGGLPVLQQAVARANEIKHPTSIERHLKELQELLAHGWHAPDIDIWLQPLSQHPMATERCIEWCKQFGYRLSLQTHKFVSIR